MTNMTTIQSFVSSNEKEMVKDREAWQSMGLQRVRRDWLNNNSKIIKRNGTSDNPKLEITLKQCCGLVARSCPTLKIPWTVAHQAPLSMGFSRQKYWSGLPFSSPGIFQPQESKSRLLCCQQSPALQVDPLPNEPPGITNKLLQKSDK